MSDWSDGYVTSTEYTQHFYSFLSPGAQNLALLLGGFMPVDLSGGYTYCELGCGQGYTTALLAAANPHGKFWGVDFNPAHVAGANKLKAAAGIANVEYLEKSFAELNGIANLPSFDFIALHGVWSWISAENRKAIMEFIYAKLKPGGVVYISYNALPGWAAIAPLRQLLIETQRHKTEIDIPAVEAALAMSKRLADMGAGYFKANAAAANNLEHFTKVSKNYLIHEYFNRDWVPFYFSDVASDLKACKLAYACSSDVLEHMNQLCLTEAAANLLKEIQDPISREAIRDYFRNPRFRRDLFTRGVKRLSQQERNDVLRQTRFVLATPMPALPLSLTFPVGAVKIQDDPGQTLLAILADGPKTLPQLLANETLAKHGGQSVFQLIMLLASRNIIQTALPQDGEQARRAATSRFNRTVLMQPPGLESQSLASPALGNGIQVSTIDQFIMALEASGQALTAEKLMAESKRRNMRLQQSQGQNRVELNTLEGLQTLLDDYRKLRLPAYKRLGVLV